MLLEDVLPASPDMARAGALIAAAGIPLAVLAARSVRRLWPWQESAVRPSWGLPELGVVVLSYFTVGLVAQVVLGQLFPDAMAIMLELASDTPPTPEEVELAVVRLLVPMLLSQVVILGFVGLLVGAWARRGDGATSLGLGRGRNVRASALGVMVWILCYPLLRGLTGIWPWLYERVGGEFEIQQWAVGLDLAGGAALAVGALLAVLVIPFLEELLFRGFLQPLLVRWLGVVGGVGTTAVVFVSLHEASAFLPLLALSLALGLVKERTQRLAACFAIHAANNGLQVALLAFPPELAGP